MPGHVYATFKPDEQPKPDQTIGTGPFILKEWLAGSHLLFVRNPNYWDSPKPYLDRVILHVIVDPAARAAALETGGIDIGANPVPLADVARLRGNPRLVVDTTTYAYSSPQQQLFDVALCGYGDVSPSPISVALPKWYDPSIKPGFGWQEELRPASVPVAWPRRRHGRPRPNARPSPRRGGPAAGARGTIAGQVAVTRHWTFGVKYVK